MLTPYMPWYGYPTASISPLQAVMGQCRCGRQSDCSTLKWVLATTLARLRTASVSQDQRQYLEMGPGNDAGASTDCVRQPGPKETSPRPASHIPFLSIGLKTSQTLSGQPKPSRMFIRGNLYSASQ